MNGKVSVGLNPASAGSTSRAIPNAMPTRIWSQNLVPAVRPRLRRLRTFR